MTKLCPAQQQACAGLERGLPLGSVFVVHGGVGTGKTTVLQEFHAEHGGVLLTMKDFMDAIRDQNPLAMEETFEQVLMDALLDHGLVILDDLHLLQNVICGCGGFTTYPRSQFLNVPLTLLTTYAATAGKKLVFACQGAAPDPVSQRCYYFGVDKFEADDYECLCRSLLEPALAGNLDFAKIHRFAPNLNAHQLKSACDWLGGTEGTDLDTDRFMDYLRSQRMASNVHLGEVQAVDLHSLRGVDDVIQSLEANIILPLESDALATEMGIKPKRGVLLAGPPGTGKTTVGRALAHRLRSKFFLVDGTFISGSRQFYEQIHQVFEAAQQNAPSIIFIDDSDVIFEDGEEKGLYRYLLTMLDGLESESAGRVCVMMTAMDVGKLPPALVRSGRIELWLETRLPDEAARGDILRDLAAALPPILGTMDTRALAAATDGLTGADLKRLIEDGKILFAYDKAKGRPLHTATEYFLAAVETVRANKERYARAEATARRQHSQRPAAEEIFMDE